MGKKGRRGGQQKRGTTISLFDFNQDVTVGKDPQLAELPSAPKLAEEWEAQGGRPEYNSRGYKERERRVDPYAEGAADDFDSRDWKRRGPVDGADERGFGTGAERDWSNTRSGPLDAAAPERDIDFSSVRRGPIEAEPSRNVDFGVRKGPVDAEFNAPGRHVDFAVRKGPVEAEFSGARDVDFGGTRKGPVEAEFAGARDVDFKVRRGPVEAEFHSAREVDFGGARKGPIEAEFAQRKEPDFTRRKGPLDKSEDATPTRNVDFANMRRTPVSAPRREFRHASNHSDNAPRRDFGTARRASGERDFSSMRRADDVTNAMNKLNMSDSAWSNARRGADRSTKQTETTVANGVAITTDPDSEWTTVRTTMKRAHPVRAIDRKA